MFFKDGLHDLDGSVGDVERVGSNSEGRRPCLLKSYLCVFLEPGFPPHRAGTHQNVLSWSCSESTGQFFFLALLLSLALIL